MPCVDASANAQGPRLNGVIDERQRRSQNFRTPTYASDDVTWDENRSIAFANPMLVAPGTSMPIGMPMQKSDATSLAYLATLSPGSSSREELTAHPTISDIGGARSLHDVSH